MNLIEKIYGGNFEEVYEDIIKKYKEKGYLIVNFLYFATIVETKLWEIEKNEKQKEYEEAIKQCDFLLPDGIALYTIFKYKYKKILTNLNGTDFIPFFINKLKPENINLIFYGAFTKDIIKAKQYILNNFKGIEIGYIQEGYNNFKRNDIILSPNKTNILLVGRGSPRQEIWSYKNIEYIKKYNLLVFNIGGLFDFWAGKEIRAPKIIRKLKGEWIWRFFLNPKKNFKKFFQSFIFLKFLLKKQP